MPNWTTSTNTRKRKNWVNEEKEIKEEEKRTKSSTALQVSIKVILVSLPRISCCFYHGGRKLLEIFAMSCIRSIMLEDFTKWRTEGVR